MVIVAVELRAPKGLGRARLGVIPNAQSATPPKNVSSASTSPVSSSLPGSAMTVR
jgi:hypothetical protein